MMHPRNVFVDLPKDRRPGFYYFHPPAEEAKWSPSYVLRKGKLRSRKNAHCRCTVIRGSKPSSTGVEVDCPKLVTDLGRPSFDVVETIVTHGRGTPLKFAKLPTHFEFSKNTLTFQHAAAQEVGVMLRATQCSSSARVCAAGCSRAQGPSGASPACSGPARPERGRNPPDRGVCGSALSIFKYDPSLCGPES
jgi:hypothetical protein